MNEIDLYKGGSKQVNAIEWFKNKIYTKLCILLFMIFFYLINTKKSKHAIVFPSADIYKNLQSEFWVILFKNF